jgi:hypothetical protein
LNKILKEEKKITESDKELDAMMRVESKENKNL